MLIESVVMPLIYRITCLYWSFDIMCYRNTFNAFKRIFMLFMIFPLNPTMSILRLVSGWGYRWGFGYPIHLL